MKKISKKIFELQSSVDHDNSAKFLGVFTVYIKEEKCIALSQIQSRLNEKVMIRMYTLKSSNGNTIATFDDLYAAVFAAESLGAHVSYLN